MIDHKDKNPRNNKIGNLRLVDTALNSRNTKLHNTNTSGVIGVSKVTVTEKSTGRQYLYWKAGWSDLTGKTHSKYFAIEKFGDDLAFELACKHRQAMIEKLNEQGAGYYENHGKN